MYRITEVVKNLIIINVIMYVAFNVVLSQFGGAMVLFFYTSPSFRVWQPLTHMFMHASFSHLFFNMLGLFFFGPIVEAVWGSGKFLRYYLICGIGSFLCQWAYWYFQYQGSPQLNEVAMLGASGAVMGVLVGVAMIVPDMMVSLLFPPITMKMKYMAMAYFALDLYMGFSNTGNVANFGHIGGAITGFVIAMIWKSQGKLRS
ncbi:MAG TPA: rhomboid family intramembrane serine protease [Saprospiraceae bacterium]|nr:rhomboid family intramembrane serine protease [Saprospiraceae bacterium]HQW55074.1 rhomboid family intramembrane serine protease [Saprospiraceae bacterium]